MPTLTRTRPADNLAAAARITLTALLALLALTAIATAPAHAAPAAITDVRVAAHQVRCGPDGDVVVNVSGVITGAPGTSARYQVEIAGVARAQGSGRIPDSGSLHVGGLFDTRAVANVSVLLAVEGAGNAVDVVVTDCSASSGAQVRIDEVRAQTGPCVDGTARSEYRGTITGAPGTAVSYRWERSDGSADAGPHTVTLPGSGTHTATTTWTRGPGSDWVLLKVTSPVTVTSNRAEVTVDCENPTGVEKPTVTVTVGECVDGRRTVEFTATVTGMPGTQVGHHWLRSDGAIDTDPQTATIPESDRLTVTTTWTRGEGIGWQSLQVTSPAEVTSDKADFTVKRCGGKPGVQIIDPVGPGEWKIPNGAPQTGGGLPADDQH